MDKNIIIVVISVLVVAVAFYYVEETTTPKLSINELYDFGTLYGIEESGALMGCTDPAAQNYDENASYGYDHNCYYNMGCCDVNASNYNPTSDSCDLPNNNEIVCNYS